MQKTILVVTQPFADYAKGDQISDPDMMDRVMETNESHVVRTQVPDDDPPSKPAKASK